MECIKFKPTKILRGRPSNSEICKNCNRPRFEHDVVEGKACPDCKFNKKSIDHDVRCLQPGREKRRAAKEIGICTICNSSFESEEHDTKCLLPIRERRKKWSEQQYCAHCKNPFSSPEHKTLCLDPLNAERQELREKGLCRDCQCEFGSVEHKEKCLNARRNLDGICWRCGKHQDSEEHQRCKETTRVAKKELYHKRADIGECPGHSGRVAVVRGRCEECWFRTFGKSAVGSSLAWKSLREMFYTQQEKCRYSGETLLPGVNASLDHIVPISRGGPRLLSNVQWTTFAINKLKDNLMESEFLLICQYNYENNKGKENLDVYTKMYIDVWAEQLRKLGRASN